MTAFIQRTSLLFLTLAICLFGFTAITSAQEDETVVSDSEESEGTDSASATSNTSGSAGDAPRAVPIRAELEEVRAENQANREELLEEAQATRAENEANRESMREVFASTSAERREEIQAQVQERKVALQARAQERITNLAANMSNRMDAVIVRIQNVIDRLDSRIEKIEATGADTTEAKAALASAQLSLNAAARDIADIDNAVANAISSEDARAGWAVVKTKYATIRDHIKTSHAELRSCVSSLKIAVAEARTASAQETE